MINLTQQDRDKFAAWLEQDAAATQGLLAQMETLRVPAALIQSRKNEIAAFLFVAKRLRAIEEMSA